MIAVMKQNTTDAQIESLSAWLKEQGLSVHLSKGAYQTIIGLVGDTSKIDEDLLASLEYVESVKRISEPFKSANRKFHPDDTVVTVDNTSVGGNAFAFIRRPLLGRRRGAADRHCQIGQGCRCKDAPRRRIQAPNLSLRFSGSEGRGHPSSP